MNKVLNRIAWVCALTLGSVFTRIFNSMTGHAIYEAVGSVSVGEIFYWFLFLMFTLLSKKLFLSKKFIEDNLTSFVEERLDRFESARAAAFEKKEGPGKEQVPPPQPQVDEVEEQPATEETQAVAPVVEITTVSEPTPAPEVVAKTSEIPKPQPPKEPNAIQRFFSENLLAKVGGILLFLGVLFLLKLVYGAIGPVGKLCIGFAIGFVLYGVGLFLDKKKLVKESRVLIGTGILINYLVILSGRYLIGDGTFTEQMILNEGITFLLLIVNTVLAVVTSLLYRSDTLLFFSFIVAFLNPFLIGADASTTPYTLTGYGMVVALGALVLGVVRKSEQNKFIQHLLTISFIGGNLLFLAAPFTSSGHWLFKLVATGVLSHLAIAIAYKTKRSNALGWYYMGSYLFLAALLTYGRIELWSQFETITIILGYLLFILLMIVSGVFTFAITSILLIFMSLAAPLVIILGLAYSQSLYPSDLVYILTTMLAIYVSIFAIIAGKLAVRLQYIFFGVLGIFACLIGLLLQPVSAAFFRASPPIIIPILASYLAIMISAFIFQVSSYSFSTRKGLQYLYSLGTGISILLLLMIIQRQGNFMWVSVAGIAGFLLLNLLTPFVNRSLLESRIMNLVLGLVAGVLFTSGEIYYFGQLYFSGTELGLAFLAQAILYFFLGYAMYSKLVKTDVKTAQDVIYTLLGISISLFSLAVAFVFSKHSEVVSAVWLFEAALIYFFYRRNRDIKLFAAASILMAIGLIKLFELIDRVEPEEFMSLIPLSVIFAAFVVMLKCLENEKKDFRWIHDVMHLAGLVLLGVLLVTIIPGHGHGWSLFGMTLAVVALSVVYARIYAHILRFILIGAWILFFIYHTALQPMIHSNLVRDNLSYLVVMQYLATILLGCGVYLYKKLMISSDETETKYLDSALNGLGAGYGLYLFVITSIYVFNFSDKNSFIITIYWGLLTFALLNYGIQKNIVRWRTIGLYILILTVCKIMFFDIWSQIDDAVYRILALMLVGGLMIAISILYQKKYDGNLLKELQYENLSLK